MAAAVPIGPIPFARSPAEAVPGVIDMTSKEGIKLYGQACKSLYEDPDIYFDCDAEGLFSFLKRLQD